MKRGQTSIEFMFLMGFMIIIFVVFFVVVQERTVELHASKNRIALQELNNLVKVELRSANQFKEGYVREFWIPPFINGQTYGVDISVDKYEINYTLGSIHYVDFLDNETYGTVQPRWNTVCKKRDYVYVNDCAELIS